MKTTMIRDVLTVVSVGGPLSEDAPEAVRRATDELKALEESHAEMARALRGVLIGNDPTVLHTDECWEADTEACIESCIAVKAALRKAGLL